MQPLEGGVAACAWCAWGHAPLIPVKKLHSTCRVRVAQNTRQVFIINLECWPPRALHARPHASMAPDARSMRCARLAGVVGSDEVCRWLAIWAVADGYVGNPPNSASAAANYHRPQAEALAAGGVDMLGAVTMTSAAEALGVSLAAHRVGLPVAISFTLEEAIEKVDGQSPPTYFGINCAHPSHFADAIAANLLWPRRIRRVLANASTRSHAELNASPDLDMGNPQDLAQRYRGLKSVLPNLGVLDGCCGTEWRHLRAIRDAWRQRSPSALP